MDLSIAAELSLVWRLPHIHIAMSRCQDQDSRCKPDLRAHLHSANVRELCLYYTALQVETHRQSCVAKDTGELLVALEPGSLPCSWGVSWS